MFLYSNILFASTGALGSSQTQKTLKDLLSAKEASFSFYVNEFTFSDDTKVEKSDQIEQNKLSSVVKISLAELSKGFGDKTVGETFFVSNASPRLASSVKKSTKRNKPKVEQELEKKFEVGTTLASSASTFDDLELPKLEAPKELFSIDSLLQKEALSEPSVVASRASDSSIESFRGDVDEANELEEQEIDSDSSLSFRGVGDLFQMMDAQENQSTDTVVQFIDDRSDLKDSANYPVEGVRVSLIGTEGSVITNERGLILLRNIPVGSEITLRAQDPEGRYLPSIFTVMIESRSQKTQVRMLREPFFSALQSISQKVQESNLASFCGYAEVPSDQDQKGSKGISIGIDSPEYDGPYFLNRFGYIDPSKTSTDEGGRFCFLNVTPGPTIISFFQGQEHLRSATLGLFAGYHTEDRYVLSETKGFSVGAGIEASTYQQLGSDSAVADSVRAIDGVDLVPLGQNESFAYIREGLLATEAALSYGKSKIHTLAYGADFETMLFSFPLSQKSKEIPVATMLPRGFVEDMAVFANVAYDPYLGSVVVEHRLGRRSSFDGMALSIKLLDENGHMIGDGYLYPDRLVAKAIFFNVEPGQYTALVESSQGDLLSSSTVLVFSETVTKIDAGVGFKRPLQ